MWCVWVCMCTYTCLRVFSAVCMYLFGGFGLCVCLRVCMCACMCLCVFGAVWMYVFVMWVYVVCGCMHECGVGNSHHNHLK